MFNSIPEIKTKDYSIKIIIQITNYYLYLFTDKLHSNTQ